MTTTRIASDGKPIEVTDIPSGLSENSGVKNSIVQPVMARDISRAGTEEYVAAAAPDKAARYRGRQLTQMLDEPLLLREEGSGTRVILEYYLKERGLAAADFARTVEIGNIGAIKTLLKSGYGVSFLYRAAIRPEEAAGTLGVIELSDFQLRHDIMFLFPKNSNFRADYTTIFQELRACAQADGACACPEA
mgnify:CR=1 FL=1